MESAFVCRLRSNCPPELKNDLVLDEDHFTTGKFTASAVAMGFFYQRLSSQVESST